MSVFRGNWIGEAPYRTGRPCSECPPSYGGGCKNNLCYRGRKCLQNRESQNSLRKTGEVNNRVPNAPSLAMLQSPSARPSFLSPFLCLVHVSTWGSAPSSLGTHDALVCPRSEQITRPDSADTSLPSLLVFTVWYKTDNKRGIKNDQLNKL